jgi:two-component system chemotaxis response regulator CheY
MKVLISDDDSTIRLLMRTLLQRRLGYEVVETSDGRKAWEALDSGMVLDLCILDMWMPELGGVDLITKLRADPRFARQKVILCSSENGRNQIMKVVSLGINGYVLKPFAADKFIDQVQKICEGTTAPPAHEVLEPRPAVLARLGTDEKAYLELLHVFTKDVTTLIAQLRNPASTLDAREMEIRLSGLRGSGRSLGALALVTVIQRLERMVPTGEPSLMRACAQPLQVQNDHVIAAMNTLASQSGHSVEKLEEAAPKPAPAKAKKRKA